MHSKGKGKKIHQVKHIEELITSYKMAIFRRAKKLQILRVQDDGASSLDLFPHISGDDLPTSPNICNTKIMIIRSVLHLQIGTKDGEKNEHTRMR